MNKMKFNEGGQPVYLDDLKLLQDNHHAMWEALLGIMTSGEEAFLLDYVERRDEGGGTIAVGGGILVAGGELCPFGPATLSPGAGGAVYVLLKKAEADMRTFEDGQARNCVETLTASLSTDPAGAEKAYKLDGLKTFLDLLDAAMSFRKGNVAATFLNGYSGRVAVTPAGTDTELRLDLSTAAEDWDASALGYRGMLFRTEDMAAFAPFLKKQSKALSISGRDLCISVRDMGTAAIVSVWPAGGAPGDFYDEGYDFPIVPRVAVTLKASDFTPF